MNKAWGSTTIGEISEVVTKGTTPTSVGFKFVDKGVNFVKVETLTKEGSFIVSKFAHIDNVCNEALKRSQLKEGDILFSIAGALGRAAVVVFDILPANTNQALAIIRLKSSVEVLPEYVLLALSSGMLLEQIEKQRGGVAQQNLSLTQVKNFEIPLPLLSEQKNIITILDKAFENISQAVTNAEKNLANARELFESYLNNVFTQKREEWVEYQLQEITTKIGSGATPRGGASSYKTEGISLIRSLNVYDRRFTDRKLALIDGEQADKLSNVIVEKGDVLFNITGASVARCCIVPTKYLPARVNQHVSILRPRYDQISADFLCYLMTSRFYKDILLGIGDEGGSTRQAITKRQLQELVVVIPNKKEQTIIVDMLDKKFKQTRRLELIYQQKLTVLVELKQSILQKAFAGELH